MGILFNHAKIINEAKSIDKAKAPDYYQGL